MDDALELRGYRSKWRKTTESSPVVIEAVDRPIDDDVLVSTAGCDPSHDQRVADALGHLLDVGGRPDLGFDADSKQLGSVFAI